MEFRPPELLRSVPNPQPFPAPPLGPSTGVLRIGISRGHVPPLLACEGYNVDSIISRVF